MHAAALLPISLLLGGAAPEPPPPGLQFGFHRMVVFQQRARELGCAAGHLDGEFEAIRKRLVRRFGKKAFAKPKIPPGGPGECFVALSIYRVNLADFVKEAEAALQSPAPAVPIRTE
jgi:hypothetical protein